MNDQEKILNDLHSSSFNSPREKIKELIRLSSIKFPLEDDLETLRKDFNKDRDLKYLFRKPCWCCGFKAKARHHIIQLQNGGSNLPNNVIAICEKCHEKIHPWLRSKKKIKVKPGSVFDDRGRFVVGKKIRWKSLSSLRYTQLIGFYNNNKNSLNNEDEELIRLEIVKKKEIYLSEKAKKRKKKEKT